MSLTLVGPLAQTLTDQINKNEAGKTLTVTLAQDSDGPSVVQKPSTVAYCCDSSSLSATDVGDFTQLVHAGKESGTQIAVIMYSVDGKERSPHAEAISAIAQRMSVTVYPGYTELSATL